MTKEHWLHIIEKYQLEEYIRWDYSSAFGNVGWKDLAWTEDRKAHYYLDHENPYATPQWILYVPPSYKDRLLEIIEYIRDTEILFI